MPLKFWILFYYSSYPTLTNLGIVIWRFPTLNMPSNGCCVLIEQIQAGILEWFFHYLFLFNPSFFSFCFMFLRLWFNCIELLFGKWLTIFSSFPGIVLVYACCTRIMININLLLSNVWMINYMVTLMISHLISFLRGDET